MVQILELSIALTGLRGGGTDSMKSILVNQGQPKCTARSDQTTLVFIVEILRASLAFLSAISLPWIP
ncbi:uncharacterized protein LOC107267898 isoform X2 [Cephus cinctus]|uniref:Uncharacterized protein LOC107267898 isoform X2 n=1 Tax=Cephus cinctus TaxID=211228 RepID=A0AAJ7BWM4_CEPCN|nr:uncharacterized protein LOC107267898 isoform X2 [Cephus cinctus]